MAEHATIVDLPENDLSQVAKSVHVKSTDTFDKINTIDITLSSQLWNNWKTPILPYFIGWCISLLPAGSVSGAPKLRLWDNKEAEKEPEDITPILESLMDKPMIGL